MVRDMPSLLSRASGGIIGLQRGGKPGNGVGNGMNKPRKTNWDFLHAIDQTNPNFVERLAELDLPPTDPVEFPLSSSRNPITASDEQILRALERMASDIHHADQVPPSLRSRIGKLGGKAIHGIGRGIKALLTGPAVFEALMTDMAMFPEELGEGEKDLYFNPDLEYIRRKRREERDRAFKEDYTETTGRPWSDKFWDRNRSVAEFLEQHRGLFRGAMRPHLAYGGSVMPGTYGSVGNRPMNRPGQQFNRPGQGLQQPQPSYGQPPATGGLQPMAGPQLLPPAGGFQAPPQVGGPQIPPPTLGQPAPIGPQRPMQQPPDPWNMGKNMAGGGVVGYQEEDMPLGGPDRTLAEKLRDLWLSLTERGFLKRATDPLFSGIASLSERIGGWDTRLRGEEEAQRLHELRQEMEESRAAEGEHERKERESELWRLIHEGREGRASGGIIGLQAGGTPPAGGGAQYQTPTADTGPGYGAAELPENYGQPEQYEGYGAPSEMQVRQEFVSPEVAGQYADITQGIMDVGTKPYEQFQGPRLAGFTGMEAAAQAGAGAYGTGPGPQGTMQAASTLGQAGRGIGQVASAAGAPGQQKDADALDPYMSQYMEGAIAPQIRSIEAQGRKARSEAGSRAAQAQAFGGYRHGLEEQAVGQATRQQIADVQATGQQQAFESAQQAYERDRTARAAGRQQQLGAYGQMRYLGGQEAALGQQQQSQQYERLREMQQAGASQRQLQQAGLDVAQQEFERQKAYPQQQLSWMSGQLGALPYQNIVQQGVYGQQPGFWSGAAGALAKGQGAVKSYEEQQLDIDKKRREEEEAAANAGG